MALDRYALIDIGNVVQNIVVWDGNPATWQPPAGLTPIRQTAQTGVADLGSTWNGATFAAGPPLPAQVQGVNLQAILSKVPQALVVNDAFLANGAPSNQDVLAQVRALTRQHNGLIRYLFNLLSDATDT